MVTVASRPTRAAAKRRRASSSFTRTTCHHSRFSLKTETTRVSVATGGTQANNVSYVPGISPDGRYAVFESSASNLVAGDTNRLADVFLRDRVTGATTRVGVATSGAQPNSYSPKSQGQPRRALRGLLGTVCREPVEQSRGVIGNIDRAERRGDPRSGERDMDLDLTAVLRQLSQTAFIEAVARTREVERSRHGLTVNRSMDEGNRYQAVALTGNFAPLLPSHRLGSVTTALRPVRSTHGKLPACV